MPGKKSSAKSTKGTSAKSRKASRSPSAKRGKSGKKSAKSRVSSAGMSSISTVREPDILDPPAMQNLYYIAHGAVDALSLRGYAWPDAPKKKGKKGKKKK